MPNKMNFGFDYYYASILAILAYIPGSPSSLNLHKRVSFLFCFVLFLISGYITAKRAVVFNMIRVHVCACRKPGDVLAYDSSTKEGFGCKAEVCKR